MGNSRLAFFERAGQVCLDLGFFGIEDVQLTLEHLRNHVGFRNQVLQFVVDIGGAHTFLTHAICLGLGKETDQRFPHGFRPHFVEVLGKAGCYVIQPHDQFGDIGIHQLGMGMHVVQSCVFDINRNIAAAGHLVPCGLDPAAQFGNTVLRCGNLCLTFADLCV